MIRASRTPRFKIICNWQTLIKTRKTFKDKRTTPLSKLENILSSIKPNGSKERKIGSSKSQLLSEGNLQRSRMT